MNKNQETALKIKNMATKLGWEYFVRDGVLTITKTITCDCNDEFVTADGEYYDILGLLPQSSPGSTWGTDGGGIGASSAIKYGKFIMHKSGGNHNILKALAKIERKMI